MTSEQYLMLLNELARIAGLDDAAGLLSHGRVRFGELDAVLVHEPDYDPDVLQVRMRVGSLPPDAGDLPRVILETNYTNGYAGECVFSLYPATDDVVVTMRVRLDEALTAQQLWQGISDIARQCTEAWQEIVTAAQTTHDDMPPLSEPRSASGLRI